MRTGPDPTWKLLVVPGLPTQKFPRQPG